jgi:hypothetical protein
VYLALPERASVASGHVLICTVEHEPSFRAADEDAFEELTNFRKCLIQMFAKQVWKKNTLHAALGIASNAIKWSLHLLCIGLSARQSTCVNCKL